MQFFDEINASSTDGSYEKTSIDARTSSYTENALLPIRGLSPLEGERDEGSCPSSRDGLTSTQHRNLTRKFDILLQLVVWVWPLHTVDGNADADRIEYVAMLPFTLGIREQLLYLQTNA